ncbi:MAG: TrkH family potassium uptake protein [Steroidobacteraceae bacterium]
MNLLVVQRILGILLILFSVTMLPPAGVSLFYQDDNLAPFLDAFFGLLATGLLIWWPVRHEKRELRLRDGFLVVAMFWVVLSLAGAVPLVLSDNPNIPLTFAVFEAVSGFTTTGATVLVGLDDMPKSLLYYRFQIQWLGGIGIVVLAVALLPMLGIGGMQLLKAETPGQVKDSKLTPRIKETAKALWVIYVLLTIACATAYWIAGMTPFDAIGHSFTTISTAGFSSHDASLGYFDSPAIETVAIIFMFIGGINFTLHFVAWRKLSMRDYWRDSELRAYTGLLLISVTICALVLVISGTFDSGTVAVRSALFHVLALMTGTGFTAHDFSVWPGALPVMLILITFAGGCAGSTTGGLKAFRWILLWNQGNREINRLIHPNGMFPVKIGGRPVPWRIIDAVWGFFAIYVVCFALLMVLLMATGVDQVTAFSAIASCMNNIGPGLGEVTVNFVSISTSGKWLCMLAMLLGRLEIYPLLILITPVFWRR